MIWLGHASAQQRSSVQNININALEMDVWLMFSGVCLE